MASLSSLLLLGLLASAAGEVHVAAAFAFGPPGGCTCSGGSGGYETPLSVPPKHLGCCKPRRNGYGFSCGPLLFATASDDDDASAGPRRSGRPKVSDEELEERREQLRYLLCATRAEMDKLVRQNPSVLNRRDVVLAHRPKVALLQERLGVDEKAAGKLCLRLLTSSLETLEVNMDLLQEKLNLTEVEMSNAIKRAPRVLAVSENENNILEVQHWMSERLGLGDARFAQMCRNKPTLLVSKVSTLEEKVDWVQEELTLSDEELGKLFGELPVLFGYDPVKNVSPKLRFLQKTFALDNQGLKNLVTKQPSLLSRSKEIVEETVQFYSGLVGESEAKRVVTKSPNLLIISLEKCLKPRLAQVQSAGKKVVWTEQLIQRLARRTPEQWERYGLGEASRSEAAIRARKNRRKRQQQGPEHQS